MVIFDGFLVIIVKVLLTLENNWYNRIERLSVTDYIK